MLGGGIGNVLAPHSSSPAGTSIQINGTITVQKTNILDLVNAGASVVDNTADLLGQKVKLQLVSVEADPVTKTGKRSQSVSVQNWFLAFDGITVGDVTSTISFTVDRNFGVPGALIIQNNHLNEFYLKSVSLVLPDQSTINFMCNSWVYNVSKYKSDRIFFSNRHCLPIDTPQGLLTLRQQELINLRGDGLAKGKNGIGYMTMLLTMIWGFLTSAKISADQFWAARMSYHILGDVARVASPRQQIPTPRA
ncbi:hypothetical protein O6H91_Y579900 [Diphasiastrum complanatum]|nr:hypothetical protein O6H91_Y579900 [Diphasiastrum complanatum]